MGIVAAVGTLLGATVGTVTAVAVGAAAIGAVAGGVIAAVNGDNVLKGALLGGLVGGVAGWGLGTFAPGLVGVGEAAVGFVGPPPSLANPGSIEAAKASLITGSTNTVIQPPATALSLSDKLALGSMGTQAISNYSAGKAQEEQLDYKKEQDAIEAAKRKDEAPTASTTVKPVMTSTVKPVMTSPITTAKITVQDPYKKQQPVQQRRSLLND